MGNFYCKEMLHGDISEFNDALKGGVIIVRHSCIPAALLLHRGNDANEPLRTVANLAVA